MTNSLPSGGSPRIEMRRSLAWTETARRLVPTALAGQDKNQSAPPQPPGYTPEMMLPISDLRAIRHRPDLGSGEALLAMKLGDCCLGTPILPLKSQNMLPQSPYYARFF